MPESKRRSAMVTQDAHLRGGAVANRARVACVSGRAFPAQSAFHQPWKLIGK